MNFLIASFSGMIATSITQPVDYVKVQIQFRSELGEKNISSFRVIKDIYKKGNSIKVFYIGLDSALMRQFVYTGTRVGSFYTSLDYYKSKYKKEPNNFINTIFSLLSGALGSFLGNPTDLALVRMQNDPDKKHYKNVFDTIYKTVKEEGILTLWRGSLPTVVRAMVINFSLLVPFEATKKYVEKYIKSENKKVIFSSAVAGFCASYLSLPFDNVKVKFTKNENEYF